VVNPVHAPVVSHVVRIEHNALLHNCPVHIRVVDDSDIHLRHRGVIRKHAASPLTAGKSNPPESKSVIDAAIVADFISPVAVMETIGAVRPAPVGRRPQRPFIWSGHPCPRHPVVISIIVGIGPVARCPHQVLIRARRLLIHRQNRRREINADTHACAELRMQSPCGQRCKQSKQKQRENAKDSHKVNLLSWLLRHTLKRSGASIQDYWKPSRPMQVARSAPHAPFA
jgi:hypothetical protein